MRVSGWESLVEGLELPDPNDRRVLAAVIRGRADVIVRAVPDQARATGRPPVTEDQLLRRLARSGALRFADAVAAAMPSSHASDPDAEESAH